MEKPRMAKGAAVRKQTRQTAAQLAAGRRARQRAAEAASEIELNAFLDSLLERADKLEAEIREVAESIRGH